MKKVPEIKILDNGFNRFQTWCPKCGCKFEYDIKSLKRGKGYYIVKCPICGNICRHSLDGSVRKDDVISKYKKQIIDELKKELVAEVAKYKKQIIDELKKELVPEEAKDIKGEKQWAIKQIKQQ